MELIEDNPVVEAALKRTQMFVEEAQKMRVRVEAQGKNPKQSKVVTEADAEVSGALTILAHVLGAAGADVLIEGLPSHSLTIQYLEEWDTQRIRKAMQRATRS